MKYVVFFVLFSSFIHAQTDASKLVDLSIQHHDPDGNWNRFKSQIDISSIVVRDKGIDTSQRSLILNIADNYFRMEQDTIVYTYPCEDCDRARMFNNYFRYLIGMPMKLKDPGTIIHENIDLEEYDGVYYKVITVTYDPEIGTDTWKFYFHPETSELRLSEFSKDGTFQKGETIELNDKTQFQSMLLPGQLRWLVLPDRTFLAEENIIYSEIKNK